MITKTYSIWFGKMVLSMVAKGKLGGESTLKFLKESIIKINKNAY